MSLVKCYKMKPPNQVRKAIPILNTLLKRMKKADVEIVLPFLNDQIQEILCECIHNCLYNKKISKRRQNYLKRKLGGQKQMYRYLSNAKGSMQKKKRLLPQTGGSLSLILATVLPLLAEYILPKLIK